MKYKIINSDIFLNGKIISEGSEAELSEDQIKGIEDYLIPLSDEQVNSSTEALSQVESDKNNSKPKMKGNKK